MGQARRGGKNLLQKSHKATRSPLMIPMKIPCPHCQSHIEFSSDRHGTVTACPACGCSVALNIPGLQPPAAPEKAKHGVFYYVFWGVVSLIATIFILVVLVICFGTFLVALPSAKSAYTDARRNAEAAEERQTKVMPPARSVRVEEPSNSAADRTGEEMAAAARDAAGEAARVETESERWARVDADIESRHLGEKENQMRRAMAGDVKTFKLLTTMSEKGDGRAQLQLAQCYLNGQGVETNVDQARVWLTRAATNGVVKATKLLNSLPAPDAQPDR